MLKTKTHSTLPKIVMFVLLFVFLLGIILLKFVPKELVDTQYFFKLQIPFGWTQIQSEDERYKYYFTNRLFQLFSERVVIRIAFVDRNKYPFKDQVLNETRLNESNKKIQNKIMDATLNLVGNTQILRYVGYNGEKVIQYELVDITDSNTHGDNEKIFEAMVTSYTEIPKIPQTSGLKDYHGEISPQVPYTGLTFKEIDVHTINSTILSLDTSDYQGGENVIDGFTFTAEKGENFEFVTVEDQVSNPGSFIDTELYGYGPSVVKGETRLGFGVPQTGRYFYIVKGRNHYRQGEVSPDGRNYSKFGIYTLVINNRS